MHNLKIYKWLDDNFYAMNEEWISGQGPLKKITEMLNEMQDNKQF